MTPSTSDGGSPAVQCRGLTKKFGTAVAVDCLTLEIPSGAVYGFLGPNGAGKTTTLELLATLTEPTSGQGFVAGHSLQNRTAIRKSIGFLPETPPIHGTLTGREQLRYALDLQGIEETKVEASMRSYVEALDLAEDLDRPIQSYSKGMRQKLAFIQVLVFEPEVLLLDEPTSGLDPQSVRTMKDLLVEIASTGTTVVLSTHVLPVVSEIADVVGVLDGGSIVAEDKPETLKSRASDSNDLESVFLSLTNSTSEA